MASQQGTVEVWDLERVPPTTGEPKCPAEESPSEAARLARFQGSAILGLRFSADGSLILGAGFDGVIGVWEADTGRRRFLIQHDGAVGGADFSPDGRHVLATLNDKGPLHAVRIYTLDLDELMAIARGKLTRGFTLEECRTYFPATTCPSTEPVEPS